jgi:hypothetical protein
MISYVTVNDGTISVDIPGEATIGLKIQFDNVANSELNEELHNYVGLKHCYFQKRKITVSANGILSPQVESIDWIAPLTLTIPVVDGAPTAYSVFGSIPTTTYDHPTGRVQWSIVFEEA